MKTTKKNWNAKKTDKNERMKFNPKAGSRFFDKPINETRINRQDSSLFSHNRLCYCLSQDRPLQNVEEK